MNDNLAIILILLILMGGCCIDDAVNSWERIEKRKIEAKVSK